jgi:hypothetical protein
MDPYSSGYSDALRVLGVDFEKTAGVGNVVRRAGGWLRGKLPSRKAVGEFFVGSPRQFVDEIRQGKALSKGSLIHKSFEAPGAFNKMLFYGMPGYEMARTAFDDQGNKAERLGGQLGGNLLGLAAFRPLGLLGSMGAGVAGDVLGSAVGRGVGRVTGTQIEQPPVAPQQPSVNPQGSVY